MEKKRRRYTLDQIEREEFKETETEISEPEVGRRRQGGREAEAEAEAGGREAETGGREAETGGREGESGVGRRRQRVRMGIQGKGGGDRG